MNTITRHVRAGRPFVEAQFASLEPRDAKASHAEQQDHQIPVGEPAAWQVIALTLSPLLVIGVVSLIALIATSR